MTQFRERASKYRAVKTEYNGRKYDSRFEARVAHDLDVRLRAGEISGWEPQFRIECMPFDANGDPVPQCKVSHKVDFRIHELDGTFTLLEAKGMETADYLMRRKWLLHFWLPVHLDHRYEVVKDKGRMWTLTGKGGKAA